MRRINIEGTDIRPAIEVNDFTETISIGGTKYSYALFRDFGEYSSRGPGLPPGGILRIVERKDGVITVERLYDGSKVPRTLHFGHIHDIAGNVMTVKAHFGQEPGIVAKYYLAAENVEPWRAHLGDNVVIEMALLDIGGRK